MEACEAQRARSADGKKRSFLTVGWSGMLGICFPSSLFGEEKITIEVSTKDDSPVERQIEQKVAIKL